MWLLEANPGPDFKQTGKRLQGVVEQMLDATVTVALERDLAFQAHDMSSLSSPATGSGTCSGTVSGIGLASGSVTHLDQAREIAAGTDFTAVYAEQWIGTRGVSMGFH